MHRDNRRNKRFHVNRINFFILFFLSVFLISCVIAYRLRVLRLRVHSFFSFPLFSLNVNFTICTHHHVGPIYATAQLFFFPHKLKTKKKRTLHATNKTAIPSLLFRFFFFHKKSLDSLRRDTLVHQLAVGRKRIEETTKQLYRVLPI